MGEGDHLEKQLRVLDAYREFTGDVMGAIKVLGSQTEKLIARVDREDEEWRYGPKAIDRALPGTYQIRDERLRQITEEGFIGSHDDEHSNNELLEAAFCYVGDVLNGPHAEPSSRWPWREDDWKPTPDDPIRQLVKAGALIAAEIDRRLRVR